MTNRNKKNQMRLIIPTIPSDISVAVNNLEIIRKMLGIHTITFIGNQRVKEILPDDMKDFFLDESQFVDVEQIRNWIVKRTGNIADGKRAGWYAQQFIKMSYSRVCEDDYYLLWDSDTIPVKQIALFEGPSPVFHMKTEYHQPYFDTMSKLMPSIEKKVNRSFIAEHMLIKTTIMREMLDEIDNNSQIPGGTFAEKIINAVDIEHLGHSGFSEFETYGNYSLARYPELYCLKNWRSLRTAAYFYEGSQQLTENHLRWLARRYDAVSFEKGDSITFFSALVQSQLYETVLNPSSLEILTKI